MAFTVCPARLGLSDILMCRVWLTCSAACPAMPCTICMRRAAWHRYAHGKPAQSARRAFARGILMAIMIFRRLAAKQQALHTLGDTVSALHVHGRVPTSRLHDAQLCKKYMPRGTRPSAALMRK